MSNANALMKRCDRCKAQKPPTEFHRRSASGDGLQNRCKACTRTERAESRAAGPKPENAERRRIKREAIVAEVLARGSKCCATCRQEKRLGEFGKQSAASDGLRSDCQSCRKVAKAAHYAANKERISESHRAWYLANPDRVRAASYAWKSANRDKVNLSGRTLHARNPEYQAERSRQWRIANPELTKDRAHRYRARRRAAKVGTVDLAALWEEQGGLCALCGALIDRDFKFPHPLSPSVDHIVPLSRGGTHEQANLQWTHLVENQRKGASVPD